VAQEIRRQIRRGRPSAGAEECSADAAEHEANDEGGVRVSDRGRTSMAGQGGVTEGEEGDVGQRRGGVAEHDNGRV
jgi:hypothetical protein